MIISDKLRIHYVTKKLQIFWLSITKSHKSAKILFLLPEIVHKASIVQNYILLHSLISDLPTQALCAVSTGDQQ